MNNKIIVDHDIEVFVTSIQQKSTYEGLMVGLPTTEFNEKILLGIKENAKKFCSLYAIYLIEPEQILVDEDSSFPMKSFGEETYLLPSVFCIAKLYCNAVYWDKTNDYLYAQLGLIWFQDDFAFPAEAAIMEKIRTVPFKEVSQKTADW